MRIAELWRYPVKSMAGEPLQVADVRETGIVGDRVVQVINAVGRTVTSRTKPKWGITQRWVRTANRSSTDVHGARWMCGTLRERKSVV